MKIVYYFDTISPYSALSWKVLRKYQSLWGFDLVLKPVFLAGIMQETKNIPPGMLPQRARLLDRDLNRSAEHFGQPILRMPTNFFTHAVPASIKFQRLLCASQHANLDREQIEEIIDSLTNGIHLDKSLRDDKNSLILDGDFISQRLEKAGINKQLSASLQTDSQSLDVKELLKSNTNEAIRAGAYGVPTMLITAKQFKKPELFFGSDRFEQIAFLTGNKWLGPNVAIL